LKTWVKIWKKVWTLSHALPEEMRRLLSCGVDMNIDEAFLLLQMSGAQCWHANETSAEFIIITGTVAYKRVNTTKKVTLLWNTILSSMLERFGILLKD
jgi:hypothetical protein